MNQYNLALAEQAKTYGLNLVEVNNENFVQSMRQVARGMIKEYGYITTDDLRKFADKHNIIPNSSNAWGAILKGKEFVACGYEKSKLVSNHARKITKWTLRP